MSTGLQISSYPAPNTYPDCFQWLTPSAVTTSGSNVTDWPDSSGNSNDANSISSTPPTTGSTINGVAAIDYATDAQLARTTVTPAYTTFIECAIFAVVQPSVTGATYAYHGVYDNDYLNSFFLGYNSTGTAWKFIMADSTSPYGTAEGGTPAAGTAQIICGSFAWVTGTVGLGYLQVNGTQVGTPFAFLKPTLTSGAPISYGGRTSSGFDPTSSIPGLYGDGIVYTAAYTPGTSQNIAIHRWLGQKWKISVP
jgi:hypothetical protein